MKSFAVTTNNGANIVKAQSKRNAYKYFTQIAKLDVKMSDVYSYSGNTNSHQASVESSYPELF